MIKLLNKTKILSNIYNVSKWVNFPRDSGILPVKPLELKLLFFFSFFIIKVIIK